MLMTSSCISVVGQVPRSRLSMVYFDISKTMTTFLLLQWVSSTIHLLKNKVSVFIRQDMIGRGVWMSNRLANKLPKSFCVWFLETYNVFPVLGMTWSNRNMGLVSARLLSQEAPCI